MIVSGDQPSSVAVPGSDLGGFVETRAGIDHLEHLAVWKPQRFPIRVRQRSERLRQLSARRGMDPLQQSPVSRGRDRERFIGKTVREHAEQGSDGEVLVDDDHGVGRSVVVLVRPATQHGVRSTDLRQ